MENKTENQECEDCGAVLWMIPEDNDQCDCDVEETHEDDYESGVRIPGVTPIPPGFHDGHVHCPYAPTRQEFEAFEKIRTSGLTNMWNKQNVAKLSGGILTPKRAVKVIQSYARLREKYPEVVKKNAIGINDPMETRR